MAMEAMLDEGARALGVQLTAEMQVLLLQFVALLAKWNRVYNLTSVRKPPDMITRHILDSLAALPYVRGPQVLDIGTGAGLPGIPLAVARPEWDLVLLDSSGKKLRFVRQVVTELGLPNVRVEHARIEEYAPEARYDTVISRAFSSLGEIYEQAARLCNADGSLIAMKGVYPVAEVEALPDQGLVRDVVALEIPQLQAQRHLVIMGPDR
ncbi:MAG: 16S rRNA (guanine(527)-N(7))-methyltransferase RsmG [Gammaproteobacteria bacterium]